MGRVVLENLEDDVPESAWRFGAAPEDELVTVDQVHVADNRDMVPAFGRDEVILMEVTKTYAKFPRGERENSLSNFFQHKFPPSKNMTKKDLHSYKSFLYQVYFRVSQQILS
jgi:hypothetical protein